MAPRVWFITGCSSGIGRELALEALSRGDVVVATARRESALADVKAAGAETMEVDVAKMTLDQLKGVAQRFKAAHGRLDFLVNNAGYMVQGTIEELSAEESQAQFDTNVFGLLNVTRAFLPLLRSQRAGVIANVSSVAAWRGSAGLGMYAASKWAASAINETLHAELAEFGIQVCSIEPGYFRSKFLTPGNRIISDSPQIDDYNNTLARRNAEKWDAADQMQPGDVTKAAKAIVDVLTQTGRASGRGIPMRLVLGSDALEIINGKCKATLDLLNEWKDVSSSTDY